MPFDPDQYLASKSQDQGAFDPDAYLAKKTEEPKSSQGMAALEGFGQGVSAGYLPQLQAGVQKALDLRDKIDAKFGLGPQAVDEKLKAQGFNIQGPDDSYTGFRDQNIARQKQEQADYPGTYAGSQVAGLVASSPAYGKAIGLIPGLAPAAKGAGLITKLAKATGTGAVQGLIQNPGDTEGKVDFLQPDQRLQNAELGGAIGFGSQLAASGIGKTAGLIADAPDKLKAFSQNKAFKAAGAIFKDFKAAFGKGRVEDLGQEMIDSGLVEPGSTFEDVAKKSEGLRQQIGQRIGQIYDKISGSVDLKVDPQKMGAELIDAVSDPKIRPKINTAAYDNKMQDIISSITSNGDKLHDVRYLNDMVGEIDDLITHSKRANDLPVVEKGYLALRQALRKSINEIADQTGKMIGDDTLGGELQALNKRYGNIAEISRISRDRVARESANRMFGLTDTIMGGGGAAAGAMLGYHEGGVKGAVEGGIAGLGLGVANKLGRTYGVPIMTSAANKVGGLLQSIPGRQAVSKAAGLLEGSPSEVGSVGSRLLNPPAYSAGLLAGRPGAPSRSPAKKGGKK